MPEAEGELAEGEANVVEVQQDPDQDPEEFSTDGTSEGKHRSITQVFNLCNYVVMFGIYVSGIELKP